MNKFIFLILQEFSRSGYGNNPNMLDVTLVAGFARKVYQGGHNPPIPALTLSG